MPKYNQPALTIGQQIQCLRDKGLVISNEEFVEHCLNHISYFRLKHYTYTFKDKVSGDFIPLTTFEQVFDLYCFDQRLRLILFDVIENIEVAIKTLISNKMSVSFGTHWYSDSKYFSSRCDHSDFINRINEEFPQQDEGSMTAYKKVYDELPPSWMVMEFLSMGRISILFEHLIAPNEKREICEHFNLPENILISWLRSLTLIRNRCAHHSRLVYRSIMEPRLPSRKKYIFLKQVEEIDRYSLYCGFCCMQYLVRKINPNSSFSYKIDELIQNNPSIQFDKIGFTPNWKEESIWM